MLRAEGRERQPTRNGHCRALTTGDIEERNCLVASGDAEPESVDATDAKAPRGGGDR